jgi:hypothetical protein
MKRRVDSERRALVDSWDGTPMSRSFGQFIIRADRLDHFGWSLRRLDALAQCGDAHQNQDPETNSTAALVILIVLCAPVYQVQMPSRACVQPPRSGSEADPVPVDLDRYRPRSR